MATMARAGLYQNPSSSGSLIWLQGPSAGTDPAAVPGARARAEVEVKQPGLELAPYGKPAFQATARCAVPHTGSSLSLTVDTLAMILLS